MSLPAIVPFPDPLAVARAAAQRFHDAAQAAVQERGRFVAVLAGGSTPRLLYQLLAAGSAAPPIPWARTVLLFGDERCVPPHHEESNYRMAREALLSRLPIPEQNVHRIEGELEPAEAAERHERVLRDLFRDEGRPRSDLLLLGVGEDGHTASLFPGTAALDVTERWVVANHVPRLAAWRVTWTFPALCSARRVLFLVAGASKAAIVAEAFGGRPHECPYPCEHVVPTDGQLEVLVDHAALGRSAT